MPDQVGIGGKRSGCSSKCKLAESGRAGEFGSDKERQAGDWQIVPHKRPGIKEPDSGFWGEGDIALIFTVGNHFVFGNSEDF